MKLSFLRNISCFLYALTLFFCVASPQAVAGDLTLVALGDSTTAGSPAFQSPREFPPEGRGDPRSQYAYWIHERHPEWRLVNQGVSGERSDQILKRFKKDVSDLKPDVVIVLAGVNDLYQGYETSWVLRNLESIYQEARHEGIRVLVCTILPVDRSTASLKRKIREVNEWIKHFSQDQGLGFCDTFQALQHPKKPGSLFSTSDGFHPDVEGYRKMARVISNALEQMGL